MEDTAVKEPQASENTASEAVLYELGYHLIPTLAEGDLEEAVSAVRSVIESTGASIVSEEFPKQRELAYSISKDIGGKRGEFSAAYFGWVRFEASPEGAENIMSALPDGVASVLRFLIVKVPKRTSAPAKRHRSVLAKSGERKDAEEKTAGEKPEPSREVLDKEIEKLIAE